MYKNYVFKDLYEWFSPVLRMFMSAKYLDISDLQKFISTKNLESFPFSWKGLLHFQILETSVVEQSLEIYYQIPLTDSYSNKLFLLEVASRESVSLWIFWILAIREIFHFCRIWKRAKNHNFSFSILCHFCDCSYRYLSMFWKCKGGQWKNQNRKKRNGVLFVLAFVVWLVC